MACWPPWAWGTEGGVVTSTKVFRIWYDCVMLYWAEVGMVRFWARPGRNRRAWGPAVAKVAVAITFTASLNTVEELADTCQNIRVVGSCVHTACISLAFGPQNLRFAVVRFPPTCVIRKHMLLLLTLLLQGCPSLENLRKVEEGILLSAGVLERLRKAEGVIGVCFKMS